MGVLGGERAVVRWKNRMNQYMHENVADSGGVIVLARRECLDRERWKLFYHGHPLGGRFWMEQVVRNYRYAVYRKRKANSRQTSRSLHYTDDTFPTKPVEISWSASLENIRRGWHVWASLINIGNLKGHCVL